MKSLENNLKDAFQHLADVKPFAKGVVYPGLGLKKLDIMTNGFRPGELWVIAGSSEVGKSSFMFRAAALASRDIKTVFISFDENGNEITWRMISQQSGIPFIKIDNATIGSKEWVEMTHVGASLAEHALFVEDQPSQFVEDIIVQLKEIQPRLVFIDPIQWMRTKKEYDFRFQEMEEINQQLKIYAKEAQITIVVASHLYAEMRTRMDKRPWLEEINRWGSLDNYADKVIMLYRDVMWNPGTDNPALAEIIIAKNRFGPTGFIYSNYVKELMLFEDFEDEF